MNITFLGTGASPSTPLVFCHCDHCEQARRLGGRNLRKRSALLIGDDLLIDLGPDIIVASFMHDIALSNVRYCLQTHPHADHLDISHLISRHPEYAIVGVPTLDIYGSNATINVITELFAKECSYGSLFDVCVSELLNLRIHPIAPQKFFRVGNYQVTAFRANHDPAVEPLLYVIVKDGQTLLYATDTAELPIETWEGFRRLQLKFDVVVLDHTYGPECPGKDHLNTRQFVEHIDRMKREGFINDQSQVFATHISHEGNPIHSELSKLAQKQGYEIAYDGLRV